MTSVETTIERIPIETYLARPGVSKSDLDRIHRCPLEYWQHKQGIRKDTATPAMVYGSLLHAAALEEREDFVVHPETYERDGERKPWHHSARECKAWRREQTKDVVDAKTANQIRSGAFAIRNDPLAAGLIKQATAFEQSISVRLDTGRVLKIRPDMIGPGWLADVKTAKDASTPAFANAIERYRYHVQAALYQDVARAAGIDAWGAFAFIVIDKGDPPLVNVRWLDPEDIRDGRTAYQADLRILDECERTNRWPGLSGATGRIETISRPQWARNGELTLTVGGEEYEA